MSNNRRRRSSIITALGLGILVEIVAIIVLFTTSLQTSPSPFAPLPTVKALPTLIPVSFINPTPPPSSDNNLAASLAIPTNSQLQNPVPQQFILRFPKTLSQAERDAYITSLNGRIIQNIGRFGDVDAVAVAIPSNSTSKLEAFTANEPDYYVASALDTNPNDQYFPQQWGFRAVNAATAWAGLSVDSPVIRVALIDSGVYDGHPDLAGQIEPGWDYVEDDAIPQDDFGHGTGVAGILAAISNNSIGLVGLAPNVRILPLRVLDSQGIGTYSDVAAAIVYAVDSGVQIINLSLGGYNTSDILQDAIDYAVQHGVQVIASAGNTGNETMLYPAVYGPVVAVGSVGSQFKVSSFSSKSSSVDLYAPGENIWTTTQTGDYAAFNGTSFAAPYVSGVAALEMAYGRVLIQNGQVVSFGGNGPQPPPPSGETPRPSQTQIDQKVIQAINTDGQAKVIINLFDPVNSQALFEPSAQQVTALQDSVLQALSAEDFTLVHRYGRLPALAGTLNASGLAVFQSQSFSASIQLDGRIFAHLAEAKDILEVDQVFQTHGLTGQGIRVAVLDTGVNHPDLSSSIVAQRCFTHGECDIVEPGDTANQSSSALDHNGHGTHVTGIISAANGIAPDSEIVALRVLGADGSGWTSDWIAALDWIIQNQDTLQINVINMSLGTSDLIGGVCDGAFGAVFPAGVQAVNQLAASGVAIFASSGNQGATNAIEAPACLSNVIAVGATYDADLGREPDTGNYDDGLPGGWPPCVDDTTTAGSLACFSNSSSQVDVLAPGAVIVSNGLGGGSAAYAGTSQASPMAAGVAALMLQADPSLVPSQIRTLMQTHGTPTTDPRNNKQFAFINAFDTIGAILADFCVGVTEIPREECHALVDFYNSTNGDDWTNNTGWLNTLTPCSWIGVGCEAGHVTALVLLDNNLEGVLPVSIGSLPDLVRLYLAFNKLSGGLPTSIGNLKKLNVLHLGTNQLSGSLPRELFSLTALVQINLAGNQFSGRLSEDLEQLSNLQILNLSVNKFTGPIPISLGSLSNLFNLSLDNNQFTGGIPVELTAATSLSYLSLANNKLTGSLPAEISNLSSLGVLTLSNNQLSGSIPASLGDLGQLNNLQLFNNQFSGSIPPELGQLINLEYFRLSNNRLSGEIPASLCNLNPEKLYIFELDGNQLSGTIPACFADFHHNMELLVTSDHTNEIHRFNGETGAYLGTFVEAGTTSLDGGQELIRGWDGNLIISSNGSSEILRYSYSDGTFLGVVVPAGSGGLKNPSGMARQNNGLYVASKDTNEILLYSAITGAFIEPFTSCPFDFNTNTPSRTHFGPDGNLYVLHQNNIVVYDGTTGVCIKEFNDFTFTGEFFVAVEMAFGPNGYLYIASDATDKDIVRFDVEAGQPVSRFVPDFPSVVTNLTFGPDGNLYVAYEFDGVSGVNRYDGTTGAFIDAFIPSDAAGPDRPTDLLFRNLGLNFDISYNALIATNPTLRAFLNEYDPDWESTQTSPPINVIAVPTSANGVHVSWRPAGDIVTPGYFEVFYRAGSGGNFKRAGQTGSKTTTFFNLNGLIDSSAYEFQVRTVSLPQGTQQNRLESTFSVNAGTTTLASGCAGVTTIPISECEALEALYNSTNGTGWTQNIGWMQMGGNTFYVASGLGDGSLRLWDVNTGKMVGEPWISQGVIWDLTFSSDGLRVVSGSGDSTLRLWDVKTGQQIEEPWIGHTGIVTSVDFSPDNLQVISAGIEEFNLRLWDVETGQQIGEPWPSGAWAVDFSPDGTKVISGWINNLLALWDVDTRQVIGEPWIGHTDNVWSVAFSPDGTKVVSGSNDNTVRLWDVETGQPIGEPWVGHSDAVYSVAFSPDGTKVVSGSWDDTLRLWDVETGQPIGEPWVGHTNSVWTVDFSPDGNQVISGGDQTLRLWDVETGQPIGEPWDAENLVISVAFSPVPTALPMNPCTWFGVICSSGHVIRLELPNNNLVGMLPAVLGDLTALQDLDLSRNSLTGNIPASFTNLDSLVATRFYNNQLTGSIPAELGGMDSLELLWLSNNQLSGELPAGLGGVGDTLVQLRLDSNRLGGALPDMWGAFTDLQLITLAGNQFMDAVPPSFVTMADSLSTVDLRYNALNIDDTDPIVSEFLNRINPDWAITQTTPPTGVEIVQVSPSNGLPSAQSTTVGVIWTPPTYTENLLRYDVVYTIHHSDGTETEGVIPIPPEKNNTIIDALIGGSEVTAMVRSVTKPHDFVLLGNPVFPCVLESTRDPLDDLLLPPGAEGTILVPLDGDCTIPTNPTKVIISGTLTPELANYSLWVLVYTPTEVFPKYYPQGRTDPICNNPRGVDIIGNTWITDVFFGREGFPEEFHVVLAAAEKNGTTDEIFKAWLKAGCEAVQADPEAVCVYPGFPLVELPAEPCNYQIFPNGVTETDAIRVHSTVPITGFQQNTLISNDSNQAAGEPPTEVEVDILNFKVEETITPGEEPLLPDGQLPSCGTNMGGKFRGSFPSGKFRGSFPSGTQVDFIVTSGELAPVMAIYIVNDEGEIIEEVKCVESGVVQENNTVTIRLPLDPVPTNPNDPRVVGHELHYEAYVWGNNSTGGAFAFQVLPIEPWDINQIPYETEAAIIDLEGEDDPNLPDVCKPTNARGKFRGSFDSGKFRGSFPSGQPSNFVITVFTHDIIPVIIVYEVDAAGNIIPPPIACQKGTQIGTNQLNVILDLDKQYQIVVISDNGLEGSFILTIEPVAVTIDHLPFEYVAQIDPYRDPGLVCGTDAIGQFRAVFNSTNFQNVFPNGIGRFRLLVKGSTFIPVISIREINPQGGLVNPQCIIGDALGSKETTLNLSYGINYLISIQGNFQTEGDFTFWFEPLDVATVIESPHTVKTNLNTTPYDLTPSCAPNSTGWFQINLPKGSPIYQLPIEEFQFGVETYSFVPVVAVYSQVGDVYTEVACETAEDADLLKMIYPFDSTLDYVFVVRSNGGTGADFEFGIASIPRLNVPTSYADCPTQPRTDALAVTHLGNMVLDGTVVMEYVTSTAGRQPIPNQQHTITHTGPIDFGINVTYPPLNEWPTFTLPQIEYPLSVIVVRSDLNARLADGRLVNRLGQGWAVVCVHALDAAAQSAVLSAIWPNLWTALSTPQPTEAAATLTPTPTLLETLTETPTETVTPETTETVEATAEVTAEPSPTETATLEPSPTLEPTMATPEPPTATSEPPTATPQPTLEPPTAAPPPTVETTAEANPADTTP